jgi:hypothetical protein
MPPLESRFEERIQRWRIEFGGTPFDEEEKQAILTLLKGMLAFNPDDRWDINQVLKSEWMVRWALPSLEE